jgi:HrpA-like RNA helicase
LTGVKRPFAHPDGDLLVLLNVYKAYQESGQSNHWCKKFNINGKAMKKAVVRTCQYAYCRVLL